MPVVGRHLYTKAMVTILTTLGYQCSILSLVNILAYKDIRKIFINVIGKNLPYFGRYGKEAFPWETYINAIRLKNTKLNAEKHNAESWLALCYAIFKEKYKKDFKSIVILNEINFGAKMISTNSYQTNMQPRSPSWGVVDLPRKKVLQLTYDPEDI